MRKEIDKKEVEALPFKKALFISPLLGGAIASLIFMIYAAILLKENYELNDISYNFFNIIKNILFISPFISFIIMIFSYILFIPSLLVGKYFQHKYEIKEKPFWFVMFLVGLVFGLIIGIINYQYESSLGKMMVIILSTSFGFLFNTSFISTLTKKVVS